MELNNGAFDLYFSEFDAHICSQIGTPVLAAGLKAKFKAVCMRVIGMRVEVMVADLEELTQCLAADLNGKVDTRFGRCGFAREDNLKYVLKNGVEDNENDDDGMITFH